MMSFDIVLKQRSMVVGDRYTPSNFKNSGLGATQSTRSSSLIVELEENK